jgi:hypothetical protein
MTFERVVDASIASPLPSSANTLFLLPNVCLNNGVFLDGLTIEELATEFDVEVIATSGAALRKRLDAEKERSAHV